jgi:GNAT superfamily N-acetyltransferase
MKSDPELVVAANLSFRGSFAKLAQHSAGGEVRETDGVFAFVTGLPIPLFNGCVVAAPATAAEIGAALEWVRERGLPFRVWIDEERAPGAAEIALARGLRREPQTYPGMVLYPVPEAPPWPPGVTVAPVGEADLAEHHAVRIASGLTPELAQRLYPGSFAADPDVQLFTARLEGEPAGGSVAIRTGDVAGVYAVGTIATARRHGVGTAASWAAVAAGRAWGCETIVLQASEMGFPIYRAMTFRTVVRYAEFKIAR